MADSPGSVLVLDGDIPSSLAIVRSLGARGLRVDAAARQERFLASYSKHCSAALVYPDPMAEPTAFVDWIDARSAEQGYELVIPVTDNTLQPLAAERARIEEHTKLAVASDHALLMTTEKLRTYELAEQLGVPFPRGLAVGTEQELVDAVGTCSYPVVVKPSRSVAGGTRDVRVLLAIRYAHSDDELLQNGRALLRHGPVILQEYYRGEGVAIEVLADHGEIVYAFQHLRLHEMPLTGGASSLRESVAVDPVLLEDVRKLIGALEYHGVAMVEFKRDPDRGTHSLMEINGRFWGSLPLAVAAGADFPAFLYDLLVLGKRPEAPAATVGTVSRKLSHDVFWFIEVMRRRDPDPQIAWPSRAAAVLDCFRVFLPRYRFDVQKLSDPKPGWVDLVRTASVVYALVRARRDRRAVVARAKRTRTRPTELDSRLRDADEVLFLCYGNINRSILAEKCMGEVNGSPRFVSAGFHPWPGRPPDPVMVEIAADHGVDLEGARSKRLDAALARTADVVLAMEAEHVLRFRQQFPEAGDRIWLLGCLGSDGDPIEIADPFGGARDLYRKCFLEVRGCTEALAARLDRT